MEGIRRPGRSDQALAVKHTSKPPGHATPGHLKSQAVAFKGQPGRGSLRGAAGWPRPGKAARCGWLGHARTPVFSSPQRRRRQKRRGARRPRRGEWGGTPASWQARPGAQAQAAAAGRRAHAGGRGGAAPGDRARFSRRARARAAAAAQKCRRAKKLTPASPPLPSPSTPPPPSLPPSFPGPARRQRRRRRRCFFFKAAPPSLARPLCRQRSRAPVVRGSLQPGRPGGGSARPPGACRRIFPFKPGVAPPPSPSPALTGSLCALRLHPKTGRRRSHNAPGAPGSLKRRLNKNAAPGGGAEGGRARAALGAARARPGSAGPCGERGRRAQPCAAPRGL